MSIEEGNKLIAEFMNVSKDSYRYKNDLLNYEDSWDWLMPVVEKIAAMDYMNFNLSSFDGAGFYDDDYKHTARGTRIFSKKDKLIDSTWQAVIQFIQWYQKQNP